MRVGITSGPGARNTGYLLAFCKAIVGKQSAAMTQQLSWASWLSIRRRSSVRHASEKLPAQTGKPGFANRVASER
jgi:hypothetical protein